MRKRRFETAVKPVAFLKVANQIRQQATDEEDRQLTESIRRHGILQPVGARPDGTLVWGHRRLRCAIAAGLTEIPAVLLDEDMTEGEYLTLQMIENVQRSDLSGFDQWQGCLRLLDANKWDQKQLAQNLGLSEATITRLLSPSRLILGWQEALKEGRVTLSDCQAAARLPDHAQGGLLALKLSGASRDAMGMAVKELRSIDKPQVRLPKVTLRLPGGTVVAVSGREEMSLDDLITKLEGALARAKKASKEQLDIRTAEKVWRDKAKA